MLTLIAIGLGAGAASALLYFAVASGTALAMVMFYVAPLPVLVAGLGWGAFTGTVAAISGAAMAGVATVGLFGLAFLIGCSAPAAYLARMALLSRPVDFSDSSAGVEWYPVGRLLTWAAGFGAAVIIIAIFAFGAGGDGLRETLQATLGEIAEDGSLDMFGIDPDADLTEMAATLALALPPIAAAVWTLTMAANLWLAARITTASGRLARPMPDLPSLELPQAAAYGFAIAVVMSFAPGAVGSVGAIVAASLTIPFLFQGLATIHAMTRGMNGRPFLLAALYSMLLLLAWTVPLIAALGLAESFLRFRDRARAGPGASPPTST